MEEDNYLYSQTVLDFVTVSTEFCKYLEQCEGTDLDNFTQIMRGLLPMLYLKATLINDVPEVAGWNEKKLTESDYEYIRSSVARIMGDKDDFLDVFVEDFKYSERELVETFRDGYEESMQVALFETIDEFKMQWGQKLLNALRAIHDVSTHIL